MYICYNFETIPADPDKTFERIVGVLRTLPMPKSSPADPDKTFERIVGVLRTLRMPKAGLCVCLRTLQDCSSPH